MFILMLMVVSDISTYEKTLFKRRSRTPSRAIDHEVMKLVQPARFYQSGLS